MAEWYYTKGDDRHGPVRTRDLRTLAAEGVLHPSDLVWREGLDEWVAASKLKGLFDGVPADVDASSEGEPAAELHCLGLGSRAGAFLVDLFLVAAGHIGGGWVFRTYDLDRFCEPGLAALVLVVAIPCLLFAGFQASPLQATPGKLIFRAKVVGPDMNRLSLGRALGRFAGKVLGISLFGLGLLLVVFTERRQTLHDLLAGSYVVRR